MKIHVRKLSVIIFLLVLGMLNLPSIDYIGGVVFKNLNNILCYGTSIASALLYLRYCTRKRIDSILIMTLVIYGWLILVTINGHGSIWGVLVRTAGCISMFFLISIMLYRPRDAINGFMLVGEIVTYLNLATIVFVPEGLYSANLINKYWLLGNKNLFAPFLLVFCIIAFFYRYQGGNRFREYGIYAASICSAVLAKSSTQIVGFFIIALLLLLIHSNKINLKIYALALVNIMLYFVIIVFERQGIFAFLIENILGKALSFSGRMNMWHKLMDLISTKSVTGFGVQSGSTFVSMTGVSWAFHAHNLILEILFDGGIVYLILYLLMMVIIYRRLHSVQAHPEAQCLIAVLFVFQIMALMEPYSSNTSSVIFIHFIYLLAYYLPDFVAGQWNQSLYRNTGGRPATKDIVGGGSWQ